MQCIKQFKPIVAEATYFYHCVIVVLKQAIGELGIHIWSPGGGVNGKDLTGCIKIYSGI